MMNCIKPLLILSILAGGVNLNAQFKSVFGDTLTIWNNISLSCDAAFVDSYIQEKDTLIAGVEYKTINDFGLMRESDGNNKLWYRSFSSSEEFLLMDLDLEVNDVFAIHSMEFIVDTVFLEDSLKVVQFDYEPPHCGFVVQLRFKESVGPNLGFRFILSGDDDDSKLIRCYTRDDSTVNYLSMYFGEDCFKDIVNVSETEKEETSITPNPFESQVEINFGTAERREIILLDIKGRKIATYSTAQEQIEIATDKLISGMYFLVIIRGDEVEVKNSEELLKRLRKK